MAETENGFFVNSGNLLYYCDKTDMTNWVVACNKLDCKHEDSKCNAYMRSRITQKGDKLYGITTGSVYDGTYIFEIKTDGSGSEIVYSFPEDDNIEVTSLMCHAFHEQMVWYYGHLDEKGMYQKNVLAIREDEDGKLVKQELFNKAFETNPGGWFPNANTFWTIRGDDVVQTRFLAEEGEELPSNSLVRIGETSLERIDLPEDVDLLGAYI